MKINEFYDAVEADDLLRGIGADEDNVYIGCDSKNLATRIGMGMVEELDWETLRAIIIGDREPVVLSHLSRVVGYFSRIDNWNRSKLGELKDRHKGSYTPEDSDATGSGLSTNAGNG
jgi:hypothetical protein